jgi:hypothetical protein
MTRGEAKQILGTLVYEHTTPAQMLHAVEKAIDGVLALERSVAQRCAGIAEAKCDRRRCEEDGTCPTHEVADAIRKEFGLEENP